MIRDLDSTILAMLKAGADSSSLLAGAAIRFDLPDADWRGSLTGLTVNCYLFDIRENRDMRTNEPLLARSADGKRAARISPPIRIDCAYCITAWSTAVTDAVLEEHQLLSEVLLVLLRNETIPKEVLQGALASQIPPYPTVVAYAGGLKDLPEFWNALDQKLKPSLNYTVTLALLRAAAPADEAKAAAVSSYTVNADSKDVIDKKGLSP
jgi:hypothetical protein